MTAKSKIHKIESFLFKPFPLIDDFYSRLFLIGFCAFFSTFFIIFYNPFDIENWSYDSAIGNLLSIRIVGILGAAILAFTQFFLRLKFKLFNFTIGQFILWVLFELILIASILFIIFGVKEEPFWKEFFTVLRHTFSLAFFPYFLACLLIAVHKLSSSVRHEKKMLADLNGQHSFKDENGKIMLAIKPDQLLFLKSENNYTSICYLQNGKLQKKLIRNKLKKLEEELNSYPNLMRIHRSFMVNAQKIISVQRKRGGFHISLDQLPEMQLKVSETYKKAFEAKIQK